MINATPTSGAPGRTIRAIAALAALTAACATAPPPATTATGPPGSDRPWAHGVSPEAQGAANAHYADAVRWWSIDALTEARRELEASLALWDHPATHVALARLGDDGPSMLRHIWAAMRHQGLPLPARVVSNLESIARIAGGFVSCVSLRCEVPGVAVRHDGRALLEGRGAWLGALDVAYGPSVLVVSYRGETTTVPLRPWTELTLTLGPDGLLHRAVTARARTPDDTAALQRHLVGFEVRWPSRDELAAWPVSEAAHADLPQRPQVLTEPRASDGDCDGTPGALAAAVCRERDDALHYLRHAWRLLRIIVESRLPPSPTLE